MKTFSRREFLQGSLALGGSLLFPLGGLDAAKARDGGFRPAYETLEREGKLAGRIEAAQAMLEECRLCPRECGVNRLDGEKGYCRAPTRVVVHSAQPHFGEEKSLVGAHGSGTIFFSNCNLRCVFCQNWPISHMGYGKEMGDDELADMMIHLQEIGCHNINLVTPTHVMPNILNATRMAMKKGLRLPLVYNTSGYERFEIIEMLDGIVDIYLPDMKFMDPEKADKYSPGASDYPEKTQRAVFEMHRQVGIHKMDDRGVAVRGLMIRHLVMPNRVAGTEAFVKWVAEKLPKSTYVNIMSQYHVDYKASEYPKIWRRITVDEYLEAMKWADVHGLTNLDPHSLTMKAYYEKQ